MEKNRVMPKEKAIRIILILMWAVALTGLLLISATGCKSYDKMTGKETVKYHNKHQGNCSICEKK